jgi:hypothetical protein
MGFCSMGKRLLQNTNHNCQTIHSKSLMNLQWWVVVKSEE